MAIYSEDDVNIQVNVSGFFDIKFYYLNSQEVKDSREKREILMKLHNSDYVIGFESKTVMSLNNLGKVLYTISLHPTDSVEYEFDEE
tara:strand:- start:1064 stop:1324 length:261 start_codon:yes stop_codon:yes gene_type:complete